MSAAMLRAVQSASAQLLAVWCAMPGAYLLLGRASGPLPKSGSARLAGQASARGIFRTFFWPLGEESAVGYLTVIRLPERVIISAESELVLRGARGADRDVSQQLTPICQEEEFGRRLASLAGASAATVARFILDLIRPEAEVDLRRPILLLESFLQNVAHHEGCVELLLEVPNRILLLQGWGPPTGDHVEIILTGCSLMRQPAQVGEFPRNDVQSPLTGSIIALPVHVSAQLSQASSVFLLTPDKVLCRRILDNRVLDPMSSIGQIRHLLPRLNCSPTFASSLQHALRPQYEGSDTLNNSERKVRAALDWAVSANTVGIFLSGWLFDPADQVRTIEYCSPLETVRIDFDMLRVDRDDVLLAFKCDPSFPRPARSNIGFAVLVPVAQPTAERSHLRFTYSDGDVAFMPVVAEDAARPGIRTELCASVDMHKPSGIEIIQRHLAPFLATADLPQSSLALIALRGPLDRPHAVVIPLPTPTLPRAVISNMLGEPLTEQEQVIFVCGPRWDRTGVEILIEWLQFYEVPATILTSPESVGAIDAVLAAAMSSRAETFMVLSAASSSNYAGLRQTLRAAAVNADVICPTVLYEDKSVRFAGSSRLEFMLRPPFTRMQSTWLGFAAKNVPAGDPAPAIGGTLECCLMTRTALTAARLARRFTTKFGQEASFFSELHANGARVVWLPAISVSTADDHGLDTMTNASALVDNWSLRAIWGNSACAS